MSRRTPWPVAVQGAAALSMWVLALGLIGIHPLLSLPWGLVAAGVAILSAVETVKPPSSKRSRFSRRTFMLNGRREISPNFSAAFFSE